MDNFNKIISFVLGLVVIVVFLAVLTGRLNFKNIASNLSHITPTPTVSLSTTPTTTPASNQAQNSNYHPYVTISSKPVTSIPSTGSPTLLLPILLSGLAAGSYLRKRA